VAVNPLWNRRHTTKFNGVSYPVQKGATACYSSEGKKQIREQIVYYLENAKLIREGLSKIGIQVYGGVNAPYIWLKTPKRNQPHSGVEGEAHPPLAEEGATRAPASASWNFFDKLLNEANVVGTPGAGFGPSGERYFRLSAFGFRDKIQEAIQRIQTKLVI